MKPQYATLAPVLARAIRSRVTGPWHGTMEDLAVLLGPLDVLPQPEMTTLGTTLLMIGPLLEREGWRFARTRTGKARTAWIWPPDPARLAAETLDYAGRSEGSAP